MKEENKNFLKETFNINTDNYELDVLEKILKLIESETIKNFYIVDAENKKLKSELNDLINKITY